MIYAGKQWFLALCVIGLNLKFWVRIESSRRMRYAICSHKLKSNRTQSSKQLLQRQVMVKDEPSVSLWPLLMHSVSQQELASHFQTQILPENRHWLCSQRNSVKWATTQAWLTGWVCALKAEITNPYNHAVLWPVSNSWHVWDVERCTSPSPALPICYKKQLKPQLSCTPVKYPVSWARHPAQTEEYKVLLTPALRVDPPSPQEGRKLDLPRAVIVQGELNHGSWALLCPRLAGGHSALLFWDSRVWDCSFPHGLHTGQRTSGSLPSGQWTKGATTCRHIASVKLRPAQGRHECTNTQVSLK